MASNKISKTGLALLIIDKQLSYTKANVFTNKLSDGETNSFEALLPKIDEFIENCRAEGVMIVWTQMVEDVKKSPANIRSKMIRGNTPTISDPDSDDFSINGLQPIDSEKVIVKYYYDAFAQTDLADYLHSHNIDTVMLVGGYGSRCVFGTAFGANGHDFNVIVVSDLIGNPNRMAEEMPGALKVMNSILGDTMDSASLIDRIKQK